MNEYERATRDFESAAADLAYAMLDWAHDDGHGYSHRYSDGHGDEFDVCDFCDICSLIRRAERASDAMVSARQEVPA